MDLGLTLLISYAVLTVACLAMVLRASGTARRVRNGVVRRMSDETKPSVKTTEFWAFVLVLAAVLVVGDGDVWLYATILTVGYMVSRGIAKAGTRHEYRKRVLEPERLSDEQLTAGSGRFSR